ncbi:hypothetical protein HMPREF1544_08912 [Mucor circinelloides 1006PhL]|uniref:Uncharacterized protein n=1 Tax=Mucor circinelloides f. circinelloides (strain 1006PhL) TaxID=1220926 RepID=S2J7M4_MUCC1|nr:hypothetical protein HMPREF1544_08912 [Mucor circinelloides 1006PhL]
MNSRSPNVFRSLCRDQVSALAIGLAGLAQLLFGVTLPCFDEKTNHQSRCTFNDLVLSFLDRK